MSKPIRILYVDDNSLDRELVRDALEKEHGGFELVTAASRADFETALAKGGFDLILSDFNILGFEGLQVLEAVHARDEKMPVIIVTGTGSEEIAVEALKRGAADYVIKTPKHILRLPFIMHAVLEKKRLEQEQRDSEERYRLIFENSGEAILLTNPDGAIYEANPEACRIFQWSEEELRKLGRQAVIDINDPRLPKALEERKRTGKFKGELNLIRKDGTFFPGDVSTTIFKDSLGNERTIMIIRDITERKRAEEALRESEERYQLANRATFNAIWDWNLQTNAIWWNENFQNLFGYRAEEIEPSIESWTNRIHPEDLERVSTDIHTAIDSGMQSWADQYRFRRKDGTYAAIEDRGYISRDASGNPLRMIGAMQDITERKQAEEKIRTQLERLTALREIDQVITSTFDIRLSLSALVAHTVNLLAVDGVTVLLLNSATNRLEYGAGLGFWSDAVKTTSLNLGESYAGRVAAEGRIVDIPNLADEPHNLLLTGVLKDENFASYHGAPLIVKGNVIGVLEIFHRSIVERDGEWLDFFNTLAGQSAIAIDDAQLFESLQSSNHELSRAYDATIEGWSGALDLRDKETEGHSQRVTEMTLHMAQTLGMSDEKLVHVRRGALLHDIGKMGVPDAILLKPGALTDEEWVIMRKHPENAYNLLSPIAYLQPALDIPYCHHEKWDGSGYPRGLKGEEIPLAARIFAVVDVWDALRSDRPYRPAWSKEKALAHIRSLAGTHFDPNVVKEFLESDLH